jgi:glycogen(starch) synthase
MIMKLLFVSNLYPPHDMGGYEQICHEVAASLHGRGHAVSVLTSHGPVESDTNRPFRVMRRLYLQADNYHYHPLDFYIRRRRQERTNERELGRAIDEVTPDLVVIWGMWNLSRCVPYWTEQRMPGRTAYYISSYWPVDPDIHQEYWQLQANHWLTEVAKKPFRALALSQLRAEWYPPPLRFEHAMCCSHCVRDTLVQAGKLPASAGVLYHGVDPEPFLQPVAPEDSSQNGRLRLLYFGSLLPHKGVHTAVEAMALLDTRGLGNRVELTILGSGHPDYVSRLRSMVSSLNLEGRVRFAGKIGRNQLPSVIRQFDVFLFTSVWAEPMARTVMEAMMAGLLVIGTEVGGQLEVLTNGDNGLTFPAQDAGGLADHIAQVLESPALRLRLARAGQQMALERFTLWRMVDDIEGWLESLIQ